MNPDDESGGAIREDPFESSALNQEKSKKPTNQHDKDKANQDKADNSESESESEKSDPEKKAGEKNDEGDKTKKADEKIGPKKPPFYQRKGFLIVAPIVLVVLLIGGIILWLILRQYESTDDAYIDGHIAQISPRASAQVVALHIRDNQFVHQGDLVVELDPTDYQVALTQAQAQAASAAGRLTQAQAQIGTAVASVQQAKAEVDAAQVQLDNANRDLDRYQKVDQRARSQQQLDNATAAQKNARAQLEQARAREVSAAANVTSSKAAVVAAEGELKTAKANEEQARVNLSYCKIYAPVDGWVTQRTVEQGNYIAVGQALFMLVDPHVWVTANYKETQLTHMRPGQPVTITVDAYPGYKWHGHVDSIQAGSGSRFSVLPAENATGNYVKIVQRVPVKIIFDDPVNTNDAAILSPGLSVIPRVKIR